MQTTTYVFHTQAAFDAFVTKEGHRIITFVQAPDRFIVEALSEVDEYGTEVLISAVYQ